VPPELLAPLLPLFLSGHPWSNNTAPVETPIPAGPTATTPFETPVPIPTATVDFSLDKNPSCYNSGLKHTRSALIESIDALCNRGAEALTEANLRNGDTGFYQIDRTSQVKGQKYTDYVTTFEIVDFCSSKNFNKSECGREFRKIVDGCNTKGENGKQGGAMVSEDCVNWRVDPNEETA
jgi:hypothetical protein